MKTRTLLLDPKKIGIESARLDIRRLVDTDYRIWKSTLNCISSLQNEFNLEKNKKQNFSRDEFRRMIKIQLDLCKKDRLYRLTVFEKKTGLIVGGISLAVSARNAFQTASIGYHINTEFRGRSFATEALKATVKFAFNTLKLHRLTAEIQPTNYASISVIKKLKFRKEGLAKNYYFKNKAWHDVLIFAITAEEFGYRNSSPKLRLSIDEF